MADGQMTQSTYLEIDGLPARVTALETTAAAIPTTYQTLTAAAKQDAALIDLINSGAKNRCKNALTTGASSRSVTATVASDGTFTLSGTVDSSSADAVFTIMDTTTLKAGTYIGSGCPSGGATASYRIDYVVNGSTAYRDTGSGVQFTVPSGGTVKAQAVVYRGKTAPAGTWSPMICSKAAYDITPDYVPYAPTNAELYAMMQ